MLVLGLASLILAGRAGGHSFFAPASIFAQRLCATIKSPRAPTLSRVGWPSQQLSYHLSAWPSPKTGRTGDCPGKPTASAGGVVCPRARPARGTALLICQTPRILGGPEAVDSAHFAGIRRSGLVFQRMVLKTSARETVQEAGIPLLCQNIVAIRDCRTPRDSRSRTGFR
jgi:hypothetical protein